MCEKNGSNNTGTVLLSFLVGGIVGAGVALLLAPQKGEETRKKIKNLAEDVKEKANEYLGEAKSKVNTVFDDGKEVLNEKKSLIKSVIDAGKEAYKKEEEKLTGKNNV
ncbi:MAG: YtxH domain-containing protein [Candidatus Firestonebacteria bacterium]|nr:YtxH domain-containing protein [Candidatus Firestonebacteria bacterium]